ncbi:hypothetical protein [Prevotella dentasini]|uniref:hypothetical protein n=1 Tax=Prevotella dentasini TaxID=589537 RepID=UPI000A5F1B1A|nr:hypothetical protein [Prevotella dentasini]
METNTFIKHRSLPACIAAGYRLWSTHLSEILIRTKWHLLATSFFAACLVAGLTAAPGTGYRPLLFLAAWAASAVSLRRSVLSMIPPEARGRNTVALLLRHPGSHLILGAAPPPSPCSSSPSQPFRWQYSSGRHTPTGQT